MADLKFTDCTLFMQAREQALGIRGSFVLVYVRHECPPLDLIQRRIVGKEVKKMGKYVSYIFQGKTLEAFRASNRLEQLQVLIKKAGLFARCDLYLRLTKNSQYYDYITEIDID